MFNNDSLLIDHQIYALEPYFIDKFKSKLTTKNGIYYSEMSVYKLLDMACIRDASTLKGRMDAVKRYMNYLTKTPVITFAHSVGAFPTMSYQQVDCVWIFNHYFQVEVLEKKKSKVIFSDGTTIIVKVSKEVLLRQQQKLHCTMDTFRSLHQEKKVMY